MKKIFTLLTTTFFSFSFAQMVLNVKVDQKIENKNRSNSELNKKSSKRIADNSAFGFEESEGFKLGSIDGQNFWYSAEDSEGYIYNNQFVVNDVNYEGSQSLALAIDDQYPEQIYNNIITASIGAFYNKESLSSDNIEFVMMPIMDNKTMYQISVSDFEKRFYRDQITVFSDDRTIYISDFNTNNFVSSGVKISNNTWYKVKIEYKPNKVNYYIDGKNVFSRNSSGLEDQIANYIDFMHSNSTNSTKLRIDNVILGNGSLNINDIDKESSIKIYPNPVSDFININNTSSEKIESITIGDLTGRTVKYVDSKSSIIDIQSLPNGVYLLKIKTNKGMKIEKIIKK
ncbi:T9SS type A sorting domain-containing protein [Empedobacter brevis]|uniref:T9SS type A sorting domain-containing protein n=1 Tax=Empedobacter brevis TaxID=247 RepID=UPI0039B0644C